jgi:hypothetical protein
MKMNGGMDMQIHVFLISALVANILSIFGLFQLLRRISLIQNV